MWRPLAYEIKQLVDLEPRLSQPDEQWLERQQQQQQ